MTLAGSVLQYLLKPAQELSANYEGKVIKVTDGDSITILNTTNQKVRVRLTGIDAPEADQPYGQESKKHLVSMVADKEVRIETNKTDRYGRVLGNVWVQPADCPACPKTMNVNHTQILSGMAWWYRQYANDQSAEDRERYESAEDEARKRRWGLWSEPDSVAPWDWRRGARAELTEGCGEKRYCREMIDCAEAKMYLNQCGLRRLDGDSDGIPCEALCRN